VVRGVFSVGQEQAHLWKPKAVIARTKDDLLRDQLSKYPACSMNHLFREIRDDSGPFLYIGLPCHLHGLRKMAVLDTSLEKKIALAIGLFCHSCLDHQALRDIFEKYGIDEREVAKIEYRGGKLPGYIRALTKKGEWLYLPYPHLGPDYYRPNAKECLTLFFKFHSPTRCRLCVDAMAEYADISIGDPWIKGWEAEGQLRRGYNFIIARTARGLNALRDAEREGAIVLEPFPHEMILRSHQPMVHFKRMRGFYNLRRRKVRGVPFPDYGFEKAFTLREKLTESIRAASYFSADRPRLRRALFRALLSRPGRLFVGALFFRRRVLQALWEKARKRRRSAPPS
jgi:coenzyme F420 hydrogenase subunit beta